MKKVFIFLVIFGFFGAYLNFSKNKVFAQDFNAQKAYQDYLYQLTNYQQTSADYEDARGFYKKNPTLQLREEARIKTLAMLKSRDQLMVVYLTALRMKLAETTGFTPEEKGGVFSKLDPEVAWYQNHITKYQDGDDLATLFNKSDEGKERYDSTTKFIIYESLFDISLSQEIGLRHDHEAVYVDLKNFINDQVSQGKLRIDPFNRWLNDTDAILSNLGQNEQLSKTKIATVYTQTFMAKQTYTSGVQTLAESVTLLSQLNNYLTEMLTFTATQSQ